MKRLLFVALSLALLALPVSAAVTRGAIYDEAGRPIEGARIEAHAPESLAETIDRLVARTNREPIATATTSSNGAFSIELPADRMNVLEVSAEGFFPAKIDMEQGVTTGSWRLQRAPRVNGHVVDPKGEPVADALAIWLDGEGRVALSARTDEKGTYSIPDPRRITTAVVVFHPDFALGIEAMAAPALSGRVPPLDLTIDPGNTITGTVVTPDGKPVANATIQSMGWILARTDENGRFSTHVPNDLTMAILAGPLATKLQPSQNGKTISLAPAAKLGGRIVDGSGNGVEGARVALSGTLEALTWTGREGTYQFSGLPRGKYNLFVMANGVGLDQPWTEVDLSRVESAERSFEVHRLPLVEGTVTDQEGRPVAGAVITATGSGAPAWLGYIRSAAVPVSGPDGRYRFTGPDIGKEWIVTALDEDHAPGRSTPVEGRGTMTRDIVLPSGHPIRGVVRRKSGEGIAGAQIAVVGAGTYQPTESASTYFGEFRPVRWLHDTDEEGAFEIFLEEGSFDLLFHKSGFSMAARPGFVAREDAAPIEVELVAGHTIEGIVVTEEGKPVAEAFVALAIGEMPRAFGMTDETGHFRFADLDERDYELRVSDQGLDADPITVTPPMTGLRITIPTGRSITGRVIDDETGLPLDTFTVFANANDEMIGVATADESGDGSFTLRVPMTVESFTIESRSDGYLTESFARTDVDLEAPLPPIEIRMKHGAVVRGTIRDGNGQPLAGVDILPDIEWQGGSLYVRSTSDDSGQYELAGLPPGSITVAFSGDEVVRKEVEVEIGAEREVTLDVTLDRGFSIRGTVVDEDGSPLEGADVTASTAAVDAESRSGSTDASGRFTIAGLVDVPYTIEASHSGMDPDVKRNVEPPRAGELDFHLRKAPTGTIVGHVKGKAGLLRMVSVSSSPGFETARVNAEGDYRVDNVRAGQAEVTLHTDGTTMKRQVLVPEGTEVHVDFEIGPTVSLEGRVTRLDKALPGARVEATLEDQTFSASASADANGRYRIEELIPGTYDIEVDWKGPTYQFILEIQRPESHDFDLSGGIIRGIVVDADTDMPVRGASVRATRFNYEKTLGPVSVETDEMGRYLIGGVQEGSHTVKVVHPSYGQVRFMAQVSSRMATTRNVKLSQTEGIDVVLVDSLTRQPLLGTVVGRDMNNIVVFDGEPSRSGNGVHLPLQEGQYKISASADGYATQTVVATVPGETVIIPVSPGGRLVVHSNSPAKRLANLIQPDGDDYVQCWCNQIKEWKIDGVYTRFDHIAAGSYTLVVWEQGTGKEYPIQIVEGQTVEVTID